MKKVFYLALVAILLSIIFCSCAGIKTGCPRDVAAWERKHAFKS